MRHYKAFQIALTYAKKQTTFSSGQLGRFAARWWSIYAMMYRADPASVDEEGEVQGIVDGLLEMP